MCKNILILFSILFLCSGCSKNPLANQVYTQSTKKQTLLSFAAENGIAYNNSINNKLVVNGKIEGPDEITIRIEKIDITTDGNIWHEIFRGNVNATVSNSGQTIFGSTTSSIPNIYNGVRIWFGDTIRAKSHYIIKGEKHKPSYISYQSNPNSYYEKNRFTNNGRNNPFVFNTTNKYLSNSFTVENDNELRLIIKFPVVTMAITVIQVNFPEWGPFISEDYDYTNINYSEQAWDNFVNNSFKEMITINAIKIYDK